MGFALVAALLSAGGRPALADPGPEVSVNPGTGTVDAETNYQPPTGEAPGGGGSDGDSNPNTGSSAADAPAYPGAECGLPQGAVESCLRGPPSPGDTAPTAPVALAQSAAASTTLTVPVVALDPFYQLEDGRRATLKNIETWVWIAMTDWTTQNLRVDAGPTWAEVTIAPRTITISPNDGVTEPKVCVGPGTPIPPDTPVDEPSPTCSLQFLQETDGDTWPVSIVVTYSVTWVGFDGALTVAGDLDDLESPPLTVPLAVLMAQPQLVDPSGD